MKIGLMLRIASLYMAVVGLGLIFAPQTFGEGAVPDDASTALVAFLRVWGTPLLGIAVLDWMARDVEPSKARDAIVLGNIVGFATIAAVDVWGSFGGGRAAHKLFALVHLAFALGFVWAGRKGRSGARS
jgi:hypothetical protein